MTMQSDWAVQKAIFTHLGAVSALTDVLGAGAAGICDAGGGDVAFPYIVLGDIRSAPFKTQSYGGHDVLLTVHIYSQAQGNKEVREILNLLHTALDDCALTVTGHDVTFCRVQDTQSGLASDGITRQGQLRLRVVTEPSV